MDENVKKKQPNKPFKQTKQLIKLALNDNWTQKDLGEIYRVSQPIISNWKKGTALAKEHQVKPLLDQYGHILRRKTFKVYWVVDGDTKKSSYIKLEGKVIFSYLFQHVEFYNARKNKNITPVVKVIVHHQGKDNFRTVLQFRSKADDQKELICNDEEGNWVSSVEKQLNQSELVQWMEDWSKTHSSKLPPDAKALPFLIRKALLNHGFTVEDVVEYPASW